MFLMRADALRGEVGGGGGWFALEISSFVSPSEIARADMRVQFGAQKFLHHAIHCHTVIRFLWVSAKFCTCTVVSVKGTLVEDKMRRFKGEYAHFSFNKCPIYTNDGASAKFSTKSHETDNSA